MGMTSGMICGIFFAIRIGMQSRGRKQPAKQRQQFLPLFDFLLLMPYLLNSRWTGSKIKLCQLILSYLLASQKKTVLRWEYNIKAM